MQSMRVAVVSRWRPDRADGVDQAVAWTSRELVALGCQVEIWEASPRYRKIARRDAENGIVVHELPVRAQGFIVPAGTREFVAKESPKMDVAHFHSCFVPANVRLAPLLRCPYVVTPHGGYSRFRMRLRGVMRKWAFFLLFSKNYLERAAFVHVLSSLERDAVEDLCRQRRFVVATSGCIGFPTAPMPWDNTKRGRCVLFIGRLDVNCKGLDRTLLAFATESGTTDQLILAGPDFRGGAGDLRELARKLGVIDRVEIRGGVFGDEKKRLIRESDVFVQLSRWEGVPLTPIEAMGAGRPVLVTPATNLADYVAAGDAGWVARDEDCRAAMRECLQASSAELHEKGTKARQVVESQFQWRHTAERLIEGYRNIRQ
jgi:glycosyltransferase involved in cell wall biosynthesis